MPLFSVDYLISLKLLAERMGPLLREIRLHNPLLFDFVCKRLLRAKGKALFRARVRDALVLRERRVK
jgi:mannonate dehydratase